jgi:hypothetical protein
MRTSSSRAVTVNRGKPGNHTGAVLFHSLAALTFLVAFSPRTHGAQTSSNSVVFSETYADKVRCVNYGGGDIECDDPDTGSYNVAATVLLAGVDISQFNGDTPFELMIGNVDLFNVLSDDPKYATNKTSAAFSYTTTSWDNNGNDHTVNWGTVKLKWSKKALTVTVNFKNNSDWDDVEYLWADQYDYNDSGPITDSTEGEIDFADVVSVSFTNVNITGSITTKDVTAKDGSDYTLSSIKVVGVGTN